MAESESLPRKTLREIPLSEESIMVRVVRTICLPAVSQC